MSASSPHAATASSASSDFPKDPTKLELENQSLKRRLVQYAATLEKLTAHARREIDASVRARDDALAAAADAAVLRERIHDAERKRDDALERLTSLEDKLADRDATLRRLEHRAASLETLHQERENDSLESPKLRMELAAANREAHLAKEEKRDERERADNLHHQLADLNRQLADARHAEARISQLDAENLQLQHAKEAAERLVSQLRGNEETVRSERQFLQRKTSNADVTIAKLKEELAAALDKANSMEHAARSVEGNSSERLSAAEHRANQAEDTVTALRAELDEVLGHLSDTKTALEEARVASIAHDVQREAVEERDALKANFSSMQDELEQSNELLTRAAIDALADKQRIRKLEDSLYKLRSTLNTEREERRLRDQKISQLTQSVQNAEHELDDLRTTKRTLSEDCHKLQLELHAKSNVVATKSRELEQLGVVRADRESTAQKLSLELSNSKNSLAKKESELVNLSAEHQEICNQLNNASKDLEGRHVEIANIRRELGTYKDRVVDLETEAERNKLTFSELQASRRQLQDLTEKSTEKDEEISEMKRSLMATKNEAASALREKKRLSDMLGEVSGDLKRANQELDILRGLRKEQEVLASRIAEMSSSSTRELNLMKQTQADQAEALVKNTVEQYQRKLEEVQMTAQRDIAASVTSQLRNDLMPHLLGIVDQKAKTIVRNLARHVESFAIDVSTDSDLSSSKHAETGAATDATSRSPSQFADNADSMLPQVTNQTTASESRSVPRSAPGSLRAGVSEYAEGSVDVRGTRGEDLTFETYPAEEESVEDDQDLSGDEHISGDDAEADETVDATEADVDNRGMMSSEVFVMMTSDDPLTEDQQDTLEAQFEAEAEYDDDDDGDDDEDADTIDDRDYEPDEDAVVGEFEGEYGQYEEREIDITGEGSPAAEDDFGAHDSGNEPAEDEVAPARDVTSEAINFSRDTSISPTHAESAKEDNDKSVDDSAPHDAALLSEGDEVEAFTDAVKAVEALVDGKDNVAEDSRSELEKAPLGTTQSASTDEVDADVKPVTDQPTELESKEERIPGTTGDTELHRELDIEQPFGTAREPDAPDGIDDTEDPEHIEGQGTDSRAMAEILTDEESEPAEDVETNSDAGPNKAIPDTLEDEPESPGKSQTPEEELTVAVEDRSTQDPEQQDDELVAKDGHDHVMEPEETLHTQESEDPSNFDSRTVEDVQAADSLNDKEGMWGDEEEEGEHEGENIDTLGIDTTAVTEEGQIDGDSGLGLYKPSLGTIIDAPSATDTTESLTNLPSADRASGAHYQAMAQEIDPQLVISPPEAESSRIIADPEEPRSAASQLLDDCQAASDSEKAPHEAEDHNLPENDGLPMPMITEPILPGACAEERSPVGSDKVVPEIEPDQDRGIGGIGPAVTEEPTSWDQGGDATGTGADADEDYGIEPSIDRDYSVEPNNAANMTMDGYEATGGPETALTRDLDVLDRADVSCDDRMKPQSTVMDRVLPVGVPGPLIDHVGTYKEALPEHDLYPQPGWEDEMVEQESHSVPRIESQNHSDITETLEEPPTVAEDEYFSADDELHKAPEYRDESENDGGLEENVKREHVANEGETLPRQSQKLSKGTETSEKQESPSEVDQPIENIGASLADPALEVNTRQEEEIREGGIARAATTAEPELVSPLNGDGDPTLGTEISTTQNERGQDTVTDNQGTTEVLLGNAEPGEATVADESETRGEMPVEGMREMEKTAPVVTEQEPQAATDMPGSAEPDHETFVGQPIADQGSATDENPAEGEASPAGIDLEKDLYTDKANIEEPTVDEPTADADANEEQPANGQNVEWESEATEMEENATPEAIMKPIRTPVAESETGADMETAAVAKKKGIETIDGRDMTEEEEGANQSGVVDASGKHLAQTSDATAIAGGAPESTIADDRGYVATAELSEIQPEAVQEPPSGAEFTGAEFTGAEGSEQDMESLNDDDDSIPEEEPTIDVDALSDVEDATSPIRFEAPVGLAQSNVEPDEPIDVDEYSDGGPQGVEDLAAFDDSEKPAGEEVFEVDEGDPEVAEVSGVLEDDEGRDMGYNEDSGMDSDEGRDMEDDEVLVDEP